MQRPCGLTQVHTAVPSASDATPAHAAYVFAWHQYPFQNVPFQGYLRALCTLSLFSHDLSYSVEFVSHSLSEAGKQAHCSAHSFQAFVPDTHGKDDFLVLPALFTSSTHTLVALELALQHLHDCLDKFFLHIVLNCLDFDVHPHQLIVRLETHHER